MVTQTAVLMTQEIVVKRQVEIATSIGIITGTVEAIEV